MTIYIGGNSHTTAIARGYLAASDDVRALCDDIRFCRFGAGPNELSRYSELTGEGVRFSNAEFHKNLLSETGLEMFRPGQVWGFCMGSSFNRIYSASYWRRAQPAPLADVRRRIRWLRLLRFWKRANRAVAFSVSHEPVSDAVIEAMVASDQMNTRRFFIQLQKAGIEFFVISSPPLKRNNTKVRKRAGTDIALYIDTLARACYKRWLNERGIDFIEPPAETMDEDGFLKDIYSKPKTASGRIDNHHANEAYGEVFIGEICRYLNTRVAGTQSPKTALSAKPSVPA